MTTAAVLLAAGAGSRFEGPTHKLAAPLRGATVLGLSVRAAVAAGLDETVVVTRDDTLWSLLPAGVTRLVNPRWAEGMATSLAVAVDHARAAAHDAIVVGLGDQPFITSDAWRAVAASEAIVAVGTYGGRRRNPVRLHRTIWSLLPRSGDEGARSVIRLRPDLVTEVPCIGDPTDIDTIEDLASTAEAPGGPTAVEPD